MISTFPAIVTTAGLVCDIVGALLVANEVVRVFSGPTTIDIGNNDQWKGETNFVQNPAFEVHEEKKRRYMKWGLALLIIGFVLQGLGTWLPIWCAAPTSATTTQATSESRKPNLPEHPR